MTWIKADSTTQPSPGHLHLIRFLGPEVFLAHYNGKDFVDPEGTPLRPLEWKPLIPHPCDHIHQLELNQAIDWAWEELSRLARKAPTTGHNAVQLWRETPQEEE